MVPSMEKALRPNPAWSGVRENRLPKSWDPAMLCIAISAIFLVIGLVSKSAKWLNAEDPLRANTPRLSSSPSNSVTQIVSWIPTNAAWFRVYASNSKGDSDPGGLVARLRRPLFSSVTKERLKDDIYPHNKQLNILNHQPLISTVQCLNNDK
jgi:hypothetical protein